MLGHLAERVAGRLRAKHRAGRTITVRVRFTGMRSVTRSLTLPAPLAATLTLTEMAEQLSWKAIRDQGEAVEISLLAISMSNLVRPAALQAELPLQPDDPRRAGSPTGSARWALDSFDGRRPRRFGRTRSATGRRWSGRTGVPDEFRELAEHD